METIKTMFALWALLFAVVLYCIPSIIATKRKHQNSAAIFVLNVLLGWTLLGWIGALIWALLAQPKITAIPNNLWSSAGPLPMRVKLNQAAGHPRL